MELPLNKKAHSINILLGVIALGWLLTQLYFTLFKPIHPMILSPIFLSFALSLVFISKPINKKIIWPRLIDFTFVGILIGVVIFYIGHEQRIVNRIPNIDPVLPGDIVVTLILLLLLLEAVRRVLGFNLLIFVSVFIAYAFLGPYSPGFTNFSGFSLHQFTEIMTLTTEGLYGTPLSATASFIFYFILFGVIFSACGGGQVLIDIGLKLGNPETGGPAKAAVISSALMGMISGSSVANVTTTGVLTIPMMKKVGYKPEQAAAIEAVASTGGQIMPPIMGVGAFIMAELLGVKYASIALAATIPALAYFLSILLLVGFIAKRNRHEGSVALEDIKNVEFKTQPILPRLYLLIPAFVLLGMVLSGQSLRSAALYSILAILALNILIPANRKGIKEIYEAFIEGIKQAANITLPIAACGIIIGVVIQSGLTNKFSAVVAAVGGSSLIAALLITMIGCMLLGMALPTVAAYLIGVVLFVPILISLGIPILIAHMFCFYFGVIAQITPPVCLASFTAAGIAGANPWKTGWTGFVYASVSFLIPFVFVYQPAILLMGSPVQIIVAALFLYAGVWALAIAISGYMYAPLHKFERLLMLTVALLLIVPELATSLVGFVLLGIILVKNIKSKRLSRQIPKMALEKS
ncbi:TRAP transporter fused permease subunit [Sporosarcina sp. Marseille-Q4063]|uniref:TRAP transporter permease n=1 Tax=Sporosarcina sp. Marseille-Q4063 TaxID=2810514 RepID=UPI001BAEB742|nr:TRAP transporter fused permease subunit [Sporosarcina sp. Marseille-Q4063]QUW21348.1 TRAP transporter fused permease subunit [Sporosarcina sp. Marseille-Q4063]